MILNEPKHRHYDVIILGSGPAGITTALELSKNPSLTIAVIESGLLEHRAFTAQEWPIPYQELYR